MPLLLMIAMLLLRTRLVSAQPPLMAPPARAAQCDLRNSAAETPDQDQELSCERAGTGVAPRGPYVEAAHELAATVGVYGVTAMRMQDPSGGWPAVRPHPPRPSLEGLGRPPRPPSVPEL